ncbi:MAG: hypothetical protein IPM01_16085 [Burkholderiaceae bacterium]|nr:hypothetical protein [Burkholderiaceae bacterium]
METGGVVRIMAEVFLPLCMDRREACHRGVVPDPDCARGIRDAGLTVAPRGWHPDPGRTGDRSTLDDLEPDDPRQRQADAAAMGDRNGAMGPHKGHDAG